MPGVRIGGRGPDAGPSFQHVTKIAVFVADAFPLYFLLVFA